MNSSQVAELRNGHGLPLAEIPTIPLPDLRQVVVDAPSLHQRVVALFGVPTTVGLKLYVALADDANGQLRIASALLETTYRSMTPEVPAVHLFERELAEQWGIRPEGHPWLKPVRFPDARSPNATSRTPCVPGGDHSSAPDGGHSNHQDGKVAPAPSPMEFYTVTGSEVHEVAVGPVHAGVIEPGHFRFQCHGEEVLHLELSLGYQHRGIERALRGGPHKRSVHYAETVAGDTTIGHALAYAQVVEGLGKVRVSARAHALRAITLELERMANHVGDLGALANDVGYLPTSSYCGRLRGEILNLTATLCGSRFGRGFVRPGGVGFDVEASRAESILTNLEQTLRDVEGAVSLLWEAASVRARFEGTGVVPQRIAEDLGLVGVVARASGLERDVRYDHPTGLYRLAQIPVSVASTGDVFARAFVRWLEIQRSSTFVKEQLGALPRGPIRVEVGELRPHAMVVSMTEGWRGEICHIAITDEAGRFATYQIVDPSFHNWTGLAMALRNEQISDFPLCNKSFNLSYCGFDR